jgi:hypothetical protein
LCIQPYDIEINAEYAKNAINYMLKEVLPYLPNKNISLLIEGYSIDGLYESNLSIINNHSELVSVYDANIRTKLSDFVLDERCVNYINWFKNKKDELLSANMFLGRNDSDYLQELRIWHKGNVEKFNLPFELSTRTFDALLMAAENQIEFLNSIKSEHYSALFFSSQYGVSFIRDHDMLPELYSDLNGIKSQNIILNGWKNKIGESLCLVDIPECDFHLALDDTNLPEGKAIDDVTEVKASTDNMTVIVSFNDGSTHVLKQDGEPTFAKQAATHSHGSDDSPSM